MVKLCFEAQLFFLWVLLPWNKAIMNVCVLNLLSQLYVTQSYQMFWTKSAYLIEVFTDEMLNIGAMYCTHQGLVY